jgi:hypothetical protein
MTQQIKTDIRLSSYLVWSEPLERAKAKVIAGDIFKSLAWYKNQTGQDAKLMVLHPSLKELADIVPEGIEVSYLGGCLAWEIWLASGEPSSVVKGYFNSARDRVTIDAGGFFCQGCLVGKPASEQSPDPRYCQDCYDFLLEEAALLFASGDKHHPRWIPIKPSLRAFDGGKQSNKDSGEVHYVGSTNLSTLTDKKIEVDKLKVSVPKVTREKKPGPKPKFLPVKKIRQLAGQGLGSKAIATRLKAEGVKISFKTIQRVLKGQRLLV